MAAFNIYWGETHDNTYQYEESLGAIGNALRVAASHMDFYAAAYYTSHSEAFRPGGHLSESGAPAKLALEGWKPQDRLDREWADVAEGTAAANAPGRFVTFPGYEWQGDGSSGDHNVFYRSEGPPVFRVDGLAELYERLRGLDALAIPHHTAYRPGVRGRDWSVFDESLSPFTEVYSVHGCSETDEEWVGMRHNSHMGPAHGGGTWQDALDRGYHIGAVCSTDNWGRMPGRHGRGLAACLAGELTRESLWRAFRARRVYGVTGDRIHLDFTVNGTEMGSVIQADGSRAIRARVVGSDAIDRIEILRNGRVMATRCHQGTWRQPEPGRRARFKIRVEAGWGPRSNEMRAPDRRWRGEVSVAGGRVLDFEPCWIGPGQGVPRIEGGAALFEMLSSTEDAQAPSQNANVFEFEADPSAELRLRMNGLEERGAVADFARSSREMWFREDAARMLQELAGIEPGSPERQDIFHHVAYKVKVHRAMPEAAYTANFEVEDDEPLAGEVNYRVRVEQRNAQRAWSSPIWVSPAHAT